MKARFIIKSLPFAELALACVIIFKPAKAEAANVNCHQQVVTITAGNWCEVRVSGRYRFSYQGPPSSTWKKTVNGQQVSSGQGQGGNNVWGCSTTNGGNNVVQRFTVTAGSLQLLGDAQCYQPGGGGGQPTFALQCERVSSSRLRWRAAWTNASAPVQLQRDSVIVHTYRGQNGPVSGSAVQGEGGLDPNTNYTGVLLHNGVEVARDSCRTANAAPPAGSLTCTPGAAGSGSYSIRWQFSNTLGNVRLYKDNILLLSGLTTGGSRTFNDPGGTFQLSDNNGEFGGSRACAPAPAATARIPYVTTIWDNLRTYGDIHIGGVARLKGTQDCSAATPFSSSLRGSAGYSGSASAISATNSISAFGSGGLPNSAARLKLGNQGAGGGYNYPICQLALSDADNDDDVNDYAQDILPKHPKGKRKGTRTNASGRGDIMTRDGSRIRYYGTTAPNDESSCGQDNVNQIISDLETISGELMIWCDLRYGFDPDDPDICDNPNFEDNPVCREDYYGTATANQPFNLCKGRNCSQTIVVKGRKTLVFQARGRVTVCRDTGGGLLDCKAERKPGYSILIGSSIEYSNVEVSSLSELPSFALVNYAGTRVGRGVRNLSGYYFSGAKRAFHGRFWSCNPRAGNPFSATGSRQCNRQLTIRGLVSAPYINFWRTGDGSDPNTTRTGIVSERVGGPEYGLIFLPGVAPPGFTLGKLQACNPAVPGGCDLNFQEVEQPPIF